VTAYGRSTPAASSNGDPDDLAQRDLHRASGGLLTTRIRRDSTPLAVALDTMIDHIESLAASR
jgi:TetR/AcrR family transcriptional repressor of nem operon